MKVGPCFGGVGLRIHPEPQQLCSWWMDAPRAGYTERCRQEWLTRMRGSAGERLVTVMNADAAQTWDGVKRTNGPWGTKASR